MAVIGQNDSQREGEMDHIFPCTEGKYPNYTPADAIVKYTWVGYCIAEIFAGKKRRQAQLPLLDA